MAVNPFLKLSLCRVGREPPERLGMNCACHGNCVAAEGMLRCHERLKNRYLAVVKDVVEYACQRSHEHRRVCVIRRR